VTASPQRAAVGAAADLLSRWTTSSIAAGRIRVRAPSPDGAEVDRAPTAALLGARLAARLQTEGRFRVGRERGVSPRPGRAAAKAALFRPYRKQRRDRAPLLLRRVMLARRVTAANEVSEFAGAGRLQFLGRPQQTVLKGDWRFRSRSRSAPLALSAHTCLSSAAAASVPVGGIGAP